MNEHDPMYFRKGFDDYHLDPERARVCLDQQPTRGFPGRRVNGYPVKSRHPAGFYESDLGRAYLAGIRHAMAGKPAPPQWQPADALP